MHMSYLVAVLVLACGGIPKGYDEGGFSASVSLPSFVADFHLDPDDWKNNESGLSNRIANITSSGVLGTAFGALIALVLSDRYGRLRCWRGFALLWASGILMQIFSSGIFGLIIFARIWLGFGAGGLTVVSPMFLSEISPAKSRGMTISLFMVFLLSFLSLGFFVNYGATIHLPPTRMQYRLVQSIPLIPVGLAFFGSILLRESPRWLAAQDRHEEAIAALAYYRGVDTHSDAIRMEVEEINEQLSRRSQTLKGVKLSKRIREILTVPTYRRRFVLAVTMQTVGQWSGGNGITYYIPTIFEYAGVGSTATSLIASGAYGLVKLVFTMVFAWILVDRIGRRPCFISGLSLQLFGHLYLLFYNRFGSGGSGGATDVAILSVFVYAVGWSIGLCTVQYLYGTEIFPTRLRGICYALNMALHWFFQFAVVRVIPTMMLSLHVWGGFLFFACICAVGLVLLFLMAPETNRVPMEEMDALFSGPWYRGWRARVESTEHLVEAEKENDVTLVEKAVKDDKSQHSVH